MQTYLLAGPALMVKLHPKDSRLPSEKPEITTNWFAILALFAAGIVAAMHFAKVSPVMDALGQDLQLSLVASGFAVSLLGIVGVGFAITIGTIVNAVGLQRGLLWALFGGALIAALGSFAPNGPLFLLSRFAEGFSHLLIVVCAPALMAAHASASDRPLALALWGCFFGLGFAITSAAAPFIVPAVGWRGLLLVHAAALLLIGAIVQMALQNVGYHENPSHFPSLKTIANAHVAVFRSGAPVLLALTFCAYTILFLATLTFLKSFLMTRLAFSEAEAGSTLSLMALVSLAFTLSSGFLVRAGLRLFHGLAVSFAGLGLAAFGLFILQPGTIASLLLLIVMMACFGLLPGLVFSNVPAVAPTPQRATLTFGAIALFGNVGTFLGTPLFAAAFDWAGWSGGAAFIITMAFAGVALAALLQASINKQAISA